MKIGVDSMEFSPYDGNFNPRAMKDVEKFTVKISLPQDNFPLEVPKKDIRIQLCGGVFLLYIRFKADLGTVQITLRVRFPPAVRVWLSARAVRKGVPGAALRGEADWSRLRGAARVPSSH